MTSAIYTVQPTREATLLGYQSMFITLVIFCGTKQPHFSVCDQSGANIWNEKTKNSVVKKYEKRDNIMFLACFVLLYTSAKINPFFLVNQTKACFNIAIFTQWAGLNPDCRSQTQVFWYSKLTQAAKKEKKN